MYDNNPSIEKIDPYTLIIYLEVPGSQVVLLQAHFELYEGLGTVRTLNMKKSLLCILSTNSTIRDCLGLLDALKNEINWRFAQPPDEQEREKYLGYYSNSQNRNQ